MRFEINDSSWTIISSENIGSINGGYQEREKIK
jgi:hypothetical protein